MPRVSVCIPLLAIVCVLIACQPITVNSTSTHSLTTTQIPSLTPSPTITTTPQPHLDLVSYGPDIEDIPKNINPLTGRAVSDSSLLELPAVLVSISNMPVSARPQAGISFASWIFEIFIGEGTTRFMSVFYGEYPRTILNLKGDCEVRTEIVKPDGLWVGNRVWLDENADSRQNDWEAGIGGVCVQLYENGVLTQSTSTNSNGYYAFEMLPGESYSIEFDKPDGFQFTIPNIGNEDKDSDADQITGRTPIFTTDSTASFWDVGLILAETPTVTPKPFITTGTPPGWFIPDEDYVGPIRSGRYTYSHIEAMFPYSCLVYASAGRGVREALHGCEIIFGADLYDPNSALLTVAHMRALAQGNKPDGKSVNYSGNLFSDIPPADGQIANRIDVFYHAYSQSRWEYDPIAGAYLRLTDQADGSGTLVPAADRLTGRQQSFENVIVIYADYRVVRHLQYDIDLSIGQIGHAYLFRDGMLYPIRWSTRSRDYEKRTGLERPMYFTDVNGNPMPLKPGRTWIHVMTQASYLETQAAGEWLEHFVQPYDPEVQ
jgi:hypothetical protein